MANVTDDELAEAFDATDDPRVRMRIIAVRLVRSGQTVAYAASMVRRREQTVYNWLKRLDKGGMAALSDIPPPGRLRMADMERVGAVICSHEGLTPKEMRAALHGEIGVRCHVNTARLWMREMGWSAKAAATEHERRPPPEVRIAWQNTKKRSIPQFERSGHTLVVLDESIFDNQPNAGRRGWTPPGVRLKVVQRDDRERVVVYGAITSDGRSMFRTHDESTKECFLKYLKGLHRKVGKMAVVMDNANQHKKALIVRAYLEANPDIVPVFLPPASPDLSAIEGVWDHGKRDVTASKVYDTVDDMKHSISEYFLTITGLPNIKKYLFRKIE